LNLFRAEKIYSIGEGNLHLGIPAVRDRVVQQALLNRMQRIFEAKFCDCSFGFRPGRSPRQAIEKVEEYLKRGCQWVVEVDIEKFFDTDEREKSLREN